MNAILALSIRHLSLGTCEQQLLPGDGLGADDAVSYYYKTLHYSQEAMQYDTYKVSLELLAISIIISTYEMLGGTSKDWERHLKGVFWIQRSQVIHGDSGGLRQGVWWAWLCQDVWAAFRERRKPFTFWRPTRALETLNQYDLAARSVYLFAQAVGFSSDEAIEEDKDLAARNVEAERLVEKLSEWRDLLTVEFAPLPVSATTNNVFEPVWVHPPAFGMLGRRHAVLSNPNSLCPKTAVSLQLYYCALILISLHRPFTGGLDKFLDRQRSLKNCIDVVCGIASTLTDYSSGVMSSQCVFIGTLFPPPFPIPPRRCDSKQDLMPHFPSLPKQPACWSRDESAVTLC